LTGLFASNTMLVAFVVVLGKTLTAAIASGLLRH